MRLSSALVLAAALTCPCAALAGGAILYETGTPEVGLASAGWAARAEDAATILTNPAGMTRVEKPDLLLGLQALYADIGFTPNAQTTTTGGDGGNPVGWFPGGGLFYVHPTTENAPARHRGHRELRVGARVRRRLGGALLRPELDAPRNLRDAGDRLEDQRQGLHRRGGQRDVRRLRHQGGGQQHPAGVARRHAEARRHHLGLRGQRSACSTSPRAARGSG